jgi:hypothetical protein
VDVESLKRALRELAEKEPAFFRDLLLEALRSDGRIADALLDLLTKHPEAVLRLARAVAGAVAIPLNVATKDDLKAAVEELKRWTEERFATKEDMERFATKEDIKQLRLELKRIEDRMATKEQIEAIAISVEDSGREMVQYLLEQRGYRCAAERLRVDEEYEFDIYCNAGVLTAVGEAKVRAGRRDVERVLERARELQRRWPDKISGKLVPVLYALVAEPSAVQRARELGVWLIESRKEAVVLEEALGASR